MSSARKESLWITAFVVLCLLPFLGKAYTIDDPLFLWLAEHIQRALTGFEAQAHDLGVAVATRCLNGDGGAVQTLADQGIRNPGRFTSLLAPGLV